MQQHHRRQWRRGQPPRLRPDPVYAGVRIRDGSTNNAILGNAIFSNGALGIDLGNYGVNANISCDAGTGANMAQNYPVLTQAVSGNGTGIRGTLNSRPNAMFLLQFFANPACGSSLFANNGQGQIYLGQTSVVTGNDCNTSFVAALPGSVPVGYVITATATDSANNTSEFSACVPVRPVPALKRQPCHQSAGNAGLDEYDHRLCAETDQQPLASDPMDHRDQ